MTSIWRTETNEQLGRNNESASGCSSHDHNPSSLSTAYPIFSPQYTNWLHAKVCNSLYLMHSLYLLFARRDVQPCGLWKRKLPRVAKLYLWIRVWVRSRLEPVPVHRPPPLPALCHARLWVLLYYHPSTCNANLSIAQMQVYSITSVTTTPWLAHLQPSHSLQIGRSSIVILDSLLPSCLCIPQCLFTDMDVACIWSFCGRGRCVRTTSLGHRCECKEGFSNLLNHTNLPCLKECEH